jgi:hypothetical protein
MELPVYLGLLESAEAALAATFRLVGNGHADEADVFHTCHTLAEQCDEHVAALAPAIQRYGRADASEPDHRFEVPAGARSGPLGLLRDLHDVYALASLVEMSWTLLQQAAKALIDEELGQVVSSSLKQTELQLAWLRTRLKAAAPQALLVAS